MLNITENSIKEEIEFEGFSSYHLLRRSRIHRLTLWMIVGSLMLLAIGFFLPWTQNISAKGYVTTRSPEQRPQAIQSVLAGRIEKWYVQEGDYVTKGDTIVHISEVKSEYFDPNLVERTSEQLEAKAQSITSYQSKVDALNSQINALKASLGLKRQQLQNKLQQVENKLKMDSIDLQVFQTNLEIANNQLERNQELYKEGLKSLSDLQEKEYKAQAARGKVQVQTNKLLNQQNERANILLDLENVEQEFVEKLAKANSELQSAMAAKLAAIGDNAKLQNQLSNYQRRRDLYYVTAPQSGTITQTLKKGLGETVKEGTDIATIMPANYALAVAVEIKPQDLPLLQVDDPVNLRFDGWPALVISGWPEASTGVFPGRVVAIDKFISESGNYRILVSPDYERKPWPSLLSVGTGVNAFILLKEVPVWYELWRQLNGFPPDFYKTKDKQETKSGKDLSPKAPLKSVK